MKTFEEYCLAFHSDTLDQGRNLNKKKLIIVRHTETTEFYRFLVIRKSGQDIWNHQHNITESYNANVLRNHQHNIAAQQLARAAIIDLMRLHDAHTSPDHITRRACYTIAQCSC